MKEVRNIIASVDLIAGSVVRLRQGDYGRQSRYKVDALEKLTRYVNDGAQRLHIVDLDGARNPEEKQTDLIRELVRALPVPVQCGGGVRSEEDVRQLLEAGVARVIVGSVAVKKPLEVSRWFKTFGNDRLVLALDCRVESSGLPMVTVDAWRETSDMSVFDLIQLYRALDLKHVLCTDVSKDGLLRGTNVQLYKVLVEQFPNIALQASGGIGSLNDIRALSDSGVDGIIIGRALLEGRFTLKEAIQCWLNA